MTRVNARHQQSEWGGLSPETRKVITEEEVPLMRFFKVDVRMP